MFPNRYVPCNDSIFIFIHPTDIFFQVVSVVLDLNAIPSLNVNSSSAAMHPIKASFYFLNLNEIITN